MKGVPINQPQASQQAPLQPTQPILQISQPKPTKIFSEPSYPQFPTFQIYPSYLPSYQYQYPSIQQFMTQPNQFGQFNPQQIQNSQQSTQFMPNLLTGPRM
jgi:hypothetical protein